MDAQSRLAPTTCGTTFPSSSLASSRTAAPSMWTRPLSGSPSIRHRFSPPRCAPSFSIPEWTVPETIIREDLQPALQHGGFFGGPSTAILEEHGLKVSYAGHPVDANSVDWANANIWQYTFTQPPGPDNVLGTLKFNFPNKHAVYMHDTVQPELFAETERSLSHGCIRVHQPDRLAALLLAEDKGWSAQQVKACWLRTRPAMVHARPARAGASHLLHCRCRRAGRGTDLC